MQDGIRILGQYTPVTDSDKLETNQPPIKCGG